MKKLLSLLVLVALVSVQPIYAQVYLGLKGGYTDAWQEYGDVNLPEDAETHVKGFNVTAQVYIQKGDVFQFGIEPGLVRRGAACVPGWNGGLNPIFDGESKFFLSYVELPVMVMARTPFYHKRFELFGKFGYGPSVMVKAVREDIPNDGIRPPSRVDMRTRSTVLNRWDHGISGGLGFGVNLKSSQIFVETGFYMGMRDAERFNRSRNRSIDYSIGYRLSI